MQNATTMHHSPWDGFNKHEHHIDNEDGTTIKESNTSTDTKCVDLGKDPVVPLTDNLEKKVKSPHPDQLPFQVNAINITPLTFMPTSAIQKATTYIHSIQPDKEGIEPNGLCAQCPYIMHRLSWYTAWLCGILQRQSMSDSTHACHWRFGRYIQRH